MTKILIIEDNDFDIFDLKNKFSSLPLSLDITIAKDGKTAVKEFQQNHYDIVFTDIGLPDIPGFDLIQLFKESEQPDTRHTKILPMSHDMTPAVEKLCWHVKADAVFSKPISAELLAQLFQKYSMVIAK